MTVNDKIKNEIAVDLELKKIKIDEAVQSMFDFLVSHMESGDLTPIRMQYMGLWQCKPTRVAKLKERGLL